jgi:Bacterial RNA polymerase, alpha chain C terminal domain
LEVDRNWQLEYKPVQENLQRLRQKYTEKPMPQRPSPIDERSWAIFWECVYEKRSLAALGKQTKRTPAQIRSLLFEIDAELSGSHASNGTTADSPLETLDLSVRSRNALHRLGCRTVGEVSALDLTQSLRQIGSKGKMEVLEALERGGFRHPAMDASPSADLSRVSRSLERLKMRIAKTMDAAMREITALQEKL